MVLNRFLSVLSDTLRLSIRVVPLKCKEGHMRFSCSGQGIVLQCQTSLECSIKVCLHHNLLFSIKSLKLREEKEIVTN
ncbi:hypothetical protein Bca101_065288 [Brassica carinata]